MGLAGGKQRPSRSVLVPPAREYQVRRGRRALAALLIGVPLLWTSSRIPVPGYTRLELTDLGSGRTLLSRLLHEGDTVVLTWKNSLFGLMVTEEFAARGGILALTRVTFADPRGGEPPHARPEELDDLYHTGGPFRVDGLARPISSVVFRIGEIGQPTMRIGDRSLRLADEVGFGGAVRLLARRPTLWERL
jgi:hypothetical protein